MRLWSFSATAVAHAASTHVFFCPKHILCVTRICFVCQELVYFCQMHVVTPAVTPNKVYDNGNNAATRTGSFLWEVQQSGNSGDRLPLHTSTTHLQLRRLPQTTSITSTINLLFIVFVCKNGFAKPEQHGRSLRPRPPDGKRTQMQKANKKRDRRKQQQL